MYPPYILTDIQLKLLEHAENMQANFARETLTIWPYRLTVRTPGSHPDNPGSIPGRVTKLISSAFR